MAVDLNRALRGGIFGLPWFFATASTRKLNDVKTHTIENFNVPHVCLELDKLIPCGKRGEMGTNKLSLYLASQLVYGLTLIVDRKFLSLQVDAQVLYDSLIRVSCFDLVKTPTMTSKGTKKRKRISGEQLNQLNLNFDENFFTAIDLPLPNPEFAITNMDLITLKDDSYKKNMMFDSFDHRNPFNIFSEQSCLETPKHNYKDKLTHVGPSAKDLMNDEISFFLNPPISSSFTQPGSQLNLGYFKENEVSPSAQIIEISLSEQHVYSKTSLENIQPVSQECIKLPPENLDTSLGVLKPFLDTPKRRSMQSLEFELDALQYPSLVHPNPKNRKRKFIRDEVTQLSYTQLRAQMDDFSDTMCSPTFYEKTNYPTIEELLSVEPYWYPKNCIPRSLFKPSKRNASLSFPTDSRLDQCSSDVLTRRNGYCYLQTTPERDVYENHNTTQKDQTMNHSQNLGILPLLDLPENQKTNKDENNNYKAPQSHYFGSKTSKSAKERITIALTESVGPVLLSRIFPVQYTSRKIAAAAFQSVLELLKKELLVVEQYTPYGEILLKRPSM